MAKHKPNKNQKRRPKQKFKKLLNLKNINLKKKIN